MLPNKKFEKLDLEFWANIKLLNQRLGYAIRKSKGNLNGGFLVPTIKQIIQIFKDDGLNSARLISNGELTNFGKAIQEYMEYRGCVLIQQVEPNLMNKEMARELFYKIKNEYNPSCPLPLNKQTGEKRDYAFLTGLVNMIIEANIGKLNCNYDPKELTAITQDKFPIRTLSRRVDGAFPSVIDPRAIWEIKEYYYTTTFGSRVADGVYETQLDGWELWESETNLGTNIKHYLIIDDYYTWWTCGRSYLCRLIDSMHMGLVTEVLFGKEVVSRLPEIVKEWISYDSNDNYSIAAEP